VALKSCHGHGCKYCTSVDANLLIFRAETDKLKKQAVLLLDALLKVTGSDDVDTKTKCLAYSGIGKLSTRLPELFLQKVNLLLAFFQTLSKVFCSSPKYSQLPCSWCLQ